jgi:hypothetical protein
MFKKFIVVLFLLFLFFSASCQNHTDSIQLVKVSSSFRYEQSRRILELQDMEFIMNENKDATTYLRKAKALNLFTGVLSGLGGAMIGYPIGHGIINGDFNMVMIAVGCGLVIVSIPIAIASRNKLKLAIDTYNSNYKPTGSVNKIDVQFAFTQSGIGLTLTL